MDICHVLGVLSVLGVLAARLPMKSLAGGPLGAHLRFSPMRFEIGNNKNNW